MGLDGLQADVELLKGEGASFVTLGKDFESVVKALKTGLTALEGKGTPPWGDDEIGENFGVAYEGLRDGMYESMGHLAAKLQEVGGALKNMAKNHEADEDFNESLMKQQVANSQANSQAIFSIKSPHHT